MSDANATLVRATIARDFLQASAVFKALAKGAKEGAPAITQPRTGQVLRPAQSSTDFQVALGLDIEKINAIVAILSPAPVVQEESEDESE